MFCLFTMCDLSEMTRFSMISEEEIARLSGSLGSVTSIPEKGWGEGAIAYIIEENR